MVRMEVICNLDLWIWSIQFGLPGTFIDLNILEVSNHFSKVLSGSFPPVYSTYTVDGKVLDWFYYLTDGIYPPWNIFVQTLQDLVTTKNKWFSSRREGIRKCIERVFGVLFWRFKILFIAWELWSVDKMRDLAKAAVVLHDMKVEIRRSTYTGDGSGKFSTLFLELEDESDLVLDPIST